MPPLPSEIYSETLDLLSSVRRRQKDLLEFQIPRLKSCNESLHIQQNLATEVREDIEVLARQIEELDISVEDQCSDNGRRELRKIVNELTNSLASIKKESRAALLISKRAIDARGYSNREELLRSSSSSVQEKQISNGGAGDDALMKANNDVTAALQRTLGLMQKELEQSVLSAQMLESSTATLRSTSTTHDMLTNMLGTSKQLITALEDTDWLDRLILIFALSFFFLVVLFILSQRVIGRGLQIAFWWTRFIPFGSSSQDIVSEKASSVATSFADQPTVRDWNDGQSFDPESPLSSIISTITRTIDTSPTEVVHVEL
ncbi:hypothetical protein SERLA73DRAFT_175454 [Serpula lacrymans var. lacrymans S7.3]|uniref:Sec20 C-terminal domain-containing protein n=2 Tax=Serpula lacrymans var. lacrymans TaxID=341189 RepID=F8PJY0_SERL3|nr:uncharacterized protein SERLADRAFT_457729 [Serpula lacrymans var. lacrymans S7.9]EGO03802.1 hypothetical protein SERLA73DRAFT_175454 [Serpula lacrymans var. lacrymans S7.3]EGO29664.1 hypothetical protein SERLADRAFT_457729 [Serpula lacrymans var. lacrymans S7.9]